MSFEDGVARIAATAPSGAGFLESRADRLADLFSEAAGRRVRVEIAQERKTQPEQAPARRSEVEIDAKHLEHPVVRDALELFNAVVARVEPNQAESSTRSS